jgi:hypothetical protein
MESFCPLPMTTLLLSGLEADARDEVGLDPGLLDLSFAYLIRWIRDCDMLSHGDGESASHDRRRYAERCVHRLGMGMYNVRGNRCSKNAAFKIDLRGALGE